LMDCGCPGYPTIQQQLRDCGNAACIDARRYHKCIRCQAAEHIERVEHRNQLMLERVLALQDAIQETSGDKHTVLVPIPFATVEDIVATNRMFPSLDILRQAIIDAYNNHVGWWQ
jgi:hypothetical protein